MPVRARPQGALVSSGELLGGSLSTPCHRPEALWPDSRAEKLKAKIESKFPIKFESNFESKLKASRFSSMCKFMEKMFRGPSCQFFWLPGTRPDEGWALVFSKKNDSLQNHVPPGKTPCFSLLFRFFRCVNSWRKCSEVRHNCFLGFLDAP